MSDPFWDRNDPLDRLERAAGTAGRVIVTGCRGIGKSALVSRWAVRRASEGKGDVLTIPPPSPATEPAMVDSHLAAVVARWGVPAAGDGRGWRGQVAALLEKGSIGGVIVDGIESYRHCLGAPLFDRLLTDLASLPGPVVLTGVPSSAVPLPPATWTELPLGPLDDELVREILERLWRSRGAVLGESSRELLCHLIGGSPLALRGWAELADREDSLEALDRAALLALHAGLLGDGVVGRWWARWWEALFPDPVSRAAACAAAVALLAGRNPDPVDGRFARPFETAGILVPTAAGSAPVADPQAFRVLRLAASRAGGRAGGEIAFLEEEIRALERRTGLAEPLRLTQAVVEVLRRWGGVTVRQEEVGAAEPLPPLPTMLAIEREPIAAPGGLPFLLLGGVAADGPLGGRWRVAVAAGGAPLASAEISSLAGAIEHLRRVRGETGAGRLWIVSPSGFTGGARTEAGRCGTWHSDFAGFNAVRAACGLEPVGPGTASAARLPRGGIEGQTVELSLPPAADVELVAAAAADCLAQMTGFGKEDRDRVRMAVVEATINALEHGGGRVELRLAAAADGIAVTVRDFGPGIAAASGGGIGGDALRRRGWGTAVMRQLMDEVRVEPVAEGAKIVLVKRRSPGQG